MIAIIDYQIGNLRSVQRAIEQVGGDAIIVTDPHQLAQAEKIILPGVAAYGDAMEHLDSLGFSDPIKDAVKSGVPYLGFCMGLQLLFDVSYEDGEYRGLGLLPGKVKRFDFSQTNNDQTGKLSIPHMGWNQIHIQKNCPMFEGIEDGSYVYFAHSYYVVPDDNAITVTNTDYGYDFTSSVWKDNIFATQFHPEKSQTIGLKMLRNFVSI